MKELLKIFEKFRKAGISVIIKDDEKVLVFSMVDRDSSVADSVSVSKEEILFCNDARCDIKLDHIIYVLLSQNKTYNQKEFI